MAVYQLDEEVWFPNPEFAEKDGLLAIGGDLSVERLVLAYCNGIFPWYNREDPIMWWCPQKRFIIRPEKVHVSHSMKKFMRKHKIAIQINRDFKDTMHRCRMKREFEEGTWITDEMEEAYYQLWKRGFAVSVEAYVDDSLAGGLYGVYVGKCFFGESMFTEAENGSKLALIMFAGVLETQGFYMMDCQFFTKHLESMGGEYVTYEEYKKMIDMGLEQL